MFVRCKMRRKDGKEHRYWSVVENVRVRGGRVVQRQVLYLGEINDSQRAAWCRSIAVLDETASARQLALFPADRACFPPPGLPPVPQDQNTESKSRTIGVFTLRIGGLS